VGITRRSELTRRDLNLSEKKSASKYLFQCRFGIESGIVVFLS